MVVFPVFYYVYLHFNAVFISYENIYGFYRLCDRIPIFFVMKSQLIPTKSVAPKPVLITKTCPNRFINMIQIMSNYLKNGDFYCFLSTHLELSSYFAHHNHIKGGG